MSNPESPYVGPRPFTKGDENIFYGRDAEAQALMSLIVSHSAVLLYSQSGAGKTSLLNAKVRGLLEARNVNVLGSSRVGGSLPPDVDPKEIENIFVYFALISLAGDEPTKELCRGNTTLLEYLESLPRRTLSDGGLVQRVIIFDQFEEIFTTSQQRWKDRDGFFEQVGLALEADPLLRVVFAMREEYLASLGVYVANLPERLRTRFHLERLRYEQALEAVTKPLKGTKRRFAPGVAEQLVRNLLRVPVRSESGFQEITGEFVEPVQLQVVCQNIWNSLGDDVNEIDAKFVESSGDVDVALTNYYEDCLRRLMEQHTIKEARLRRWFDNELITTDGLRGIVYQGETTTGTLPNKVVAMLEDLRLVRAEPRGGALWYELTHDRFIAPIRKSNRLWFNKQQGSLGSVLEIKALEYKKDPREENLLTGSELENALKWVETEREDSEVSDSLRAYIVDSKNASEKRRARSLRRQVAVLVLLFLGALFLAGWAYYEKGRADSARYVERADVALTMIELKKYYDALVWGLKSVEPSLISGVKPPRQGIDSVRNALKASGGNLWSRTFSERQMVAITPDGSFVMTLDDRELILWNGLNGQQVFVQKTSEEDKIPEGEKRAEYSPGIVRASFSRAGKFLVLLRVLSAIDDFRPGGNEKRARYLYQLEVLDLQNNLQQVIKESGARSVEFAYDDSKLFISDYRRGSVIDLATKRTIFSIAKNAQRTFLSPTGDQLVQLTGKEIVFWNLKYETVKKAATQLVIGDLGSVSCTFSDDGKTAVIFQDQDSENSPATVWDVESGRKIQGITINSQGEAVHFKVLSGNRSVFIMKVFGETSLQIWDLGNNTVSKINFSETGFTYDHESGHLLLHKPSSVQILNNPRDQTNVVEFNGLPEKFSTFMPSQQLTSAITLSEDNVLQYWKPGSFSAEVDKLPERELYRAACNKLRYQEKEFKQVATLCEPLLK